MPNLRSVLLGVAWLITASRGFGQDPKPAAKAEVTVTYDLRDLIQEPRWGSKLPEENIVQLLQYAADAGIAERVSIQVIDQSKFVVRAEPKIQAEFASLLKAIRNRNDLSLEIQAWLYEVNETFYLRLLQAKKRSIDEAERLFLEGKLPPCTLFKDLLNQKLVLTGDKHSTVNQNEFMLLGKRNWQLFRSNREDFFKGKEKQMLLDGLTIHGAFSSNWDRRYVRARITEKLKTLDRVEATKPPEIDEKVDENLPKDVQKNLLDQIKIHNRVHEEVFAKDQAFSSMHHISDGGQILIALKARPKSLEEKNRWYVLKLQANILIAEEQRLMRDTAMAHLMPALLDDILKNPQWKSARALFAEPEDLRYSLVKSQTWDPKESAKIEINDKHEHANFEIAGYQLVPAKKGLLGIRIDRIESRQDRTHVTATLLSVGRSELGEFSIRYRTQAGDEKKVEVDRSAE